MKNKVYNKKIKKASSESQVDVNYEFVKPYFSANKKGSNYYKALDHFYHMSFHFDGYFVHLPTNEESLQSKSFVDNTGTDTKNYYFDRLITIRRPSESESILAYRQLIYLPVTKAPCFKVYNSLRKIVKSPDWNIDYKEAKVPSGIADDESLENYCEHNYPNFNSVEQWAYNYAMKSMLIDANGLIYVLPLPKENEEDATEYYRPVATIVNSKHLLEYKEDEYAIFVHEDAWEYKSGVNMRKGKKLGIITKKGYWEARQINDKKEFDLVEILAFDLEYMPAWVVGGVPKHVHKNKILWESFMSPMLPGLDAMARESSDADADVVQHMYLTFWQYAQQDCRHCMGTGRVNGKGKQVIACKECNGTGGMPLSPYRSAVYKSDGVDSKTPTPPMGYVIKPTDIVKLMADRLEKHEWNALSSINHEFLAETPLNQSGKAKEVDRQELYNYTYQIAYHFVEFLIKDVYYFINEFRYFDLVKSPEQREAMLPEISIPEKFDFIDSAMQEAQLKAAKDSNMDAMVVGAMEIDYVKKNFPNNESLMKKLRLKKELDPFPSLSIDQKQNLSLGKVVDQKDIVLTIYIDSFIGHALMDNPDFCDLDYDKQMEKMYELADEKMTDMQASSKVQAKVDLKNNPPPPPPIDPKTGKPIVAPPKPFGK
jgi:hypothetical protein